MVSAKELQPKLIKLSGDSRSLNVADALAGSLNSAQVSRPEDSSVRLISINNDITASGNSAQHENEVQILPQQNSFSLPTDTTKRENAEKRPYNKTAVWAGIFTAAGIVLTALISVFGTIGLILGIIALHKFKKNPSQRGRGFAIAAIILGIISFIILVAIIVFFVECSQPGADCP